MKEEEVVEVINRSFTTTWFRAVDLIPHLESAQYEESYFDMIGILAKLAGEDRLDADTGHYWFRLKKEAR
ncbi:MAG: hypothetical protein JRN09_05505 [Nitrososphaerota archaeon]|jgi:hypothetical protein|nr:hypothetical protein [Nitrososphaerota archaeon]